ncbi:DUF99 family protein [Candidatus Woesearchaeota archaeon]|nr:DUF99 family protein [Candidatus Woesearchaeota archaeon]
MVKEEIRVLGIDDAPFDKFKGDRETLVIATFFRGGSFIDGVLSTRIEVDGSDSTWKLIEMVNGCKFRPQLQCLMLDGIAVGGFNIVDVTELSSRTGLPVIVVVRDYPDFERIITVLKNLKMEEKIRLIEKAGKVEKIGNVYCQLINITSEKAAEIIRVTATHSFIPEPIRAAHIIASGLVFGESRGKV